MSKMRTYFGSEILLGVYSGWRRWEIEHRIIVEESLVLIEGVLGNLLMKIMEWRRGFLDWKEETLLLL